VGRMGLTNVIFFFKFSSLQNENVKSPGGEERNNEEGGLKSAKKVSHII